MGMQSPNYYYLALLRVWLLTHIAVAFVAPAKCLYHTHSAFWQSYGNSDVTYRSSDYHHRTFLRDSSFSHHREHFETPEIQEMEDLILCLSKEPTDSSRRTRLEQIFDERMIQDDSTRTRFVNLFDMVLANVGDQVRLDAVEFAAANNNQPQQDLPDEVSSTSSLPLDAKRTEAELQLWALIDMLVQSKTIVKRHRANGNVNRSEAT